MAVGLLGLPGAGKSTVAAALGMDVVSRDAVRVELGAGVAEKERLFGEVLARVADLLAAGRDVAVDLPFSAEAQRRALRDRAAEHGAGSLLVLLDVPADVARRRVGGAPHVAEDRSPALVDAVAARFAPAGPDVLRLDATRPVAELARAIRAAAERAASAAGHP